MSRELKNIGLPFSHFVICPVKQTENISSYTSHLKDSNTGTKKVKALEFAPKRLGLIEKSERGNRKSLLQPQ